MVTSFYAGLLALLIVWLSLGVIKIRRAKKVRLGDGGEADLQAAIRAQGNAVEYIPISVILLLLLELGNASPVLIHIGGMALLVGRLLHAKGLLTDNLKYRVLGMQTTIYTLIGLATVNIAYALFRGIQAI
jgi:uncharacterized membrane protein YecN with MAPEG domain